MVAGCGPSEESRREAEKVYNSTLEILTPVNEADSGFADCMQYLLREIQDPNIRKDKKKNRIVTDSIGLLSGLNDLVEEQISEAISAMKKLRSNHEQFEILTAADSLLAKYKDISGRVFPEISESMKTISLPVKDAEYTRILQLTFEADSVLNAAVAAFNAKSAAFREHYSIGKQE